MMAKIENIRWGWVTERTICSPAVRVRSPWGRLARWARRLAGRTIGRWMMARRYGR